MTRELKKGDKVQWQSHGTTVTGDVEEKITSDTSAAGRDVRASKTTLNIGLSATRAAAMRCTSPTR